MELTRRAFAILVLALSLASCYAEPSEASNRPDADDPSLIPWPGLQIDISMQDKETDFIRFFRIDEERAPRLAVGVVYTNQTGHTIDDISPLSFIFFDRNRLKIGEFRLDPPLLWMDTFEDGETLKGELGVLEGVSSFYDRQRLARELDRCAFVQIVRPDGSPLLPRSPETH